MLRQILNNPFGKSGVILLLLVGTIYAVTFFTRPRPSERNRTVTRAGYSLIHPDGWSAGSSNPGREAGFIRVPIRDAISFSPDRYIGIAPHIDVRQFAETPDLKQFRDNHWVDGQFQGSSAILFQGRIKRWFYRAALFERGGQWFEVGELLPNAETINSEQWWKFVETFRYPEPGVTIQPDRATMTSTTAKSATEPATAPFVMPIDQ